MIGDIADGSPSQTQESTIGEGGSNNKISWKKEASKNSRIMRFITLKHGKERERGKSSCNRQDFY